MADFLPPPKSTNGSQVAEYRKKPWLATLLNVIAPGAGYLYVGTRRTFGTLLIITVVAGYLSGILDTSSNQTSIQGIAGWINLAAVALGMIAFGYDAYQEALKTKIL